MEYEEFFKRNYGIFSRDEQERIRQAGIPKSAPGLNLFEIHGVCQAYFERTFNQFPNDHLFLKGLAFQESSILTVCLKHVVQLISTLG
jgi:hypothetical protein